jgi:hypothetical protein
MAFLNDRVYDNGLTVLDTEANQMHITSQEAVSFVDATVTSTLGFSATVVVSAPQARTGGGREVELSSITDGAVTASGSATHYAIVDTVNSRLLVSGTLGVPQVVTSGNTFTFAPVTIGIPAPA